MANRTSTIRPIVIDLGKQRRKRIKQLKRGRGKAMDKIEAALEQLRDDPEFSAEMNGRDLVPVVIVYRRKRKKRKNRGLSLPLLF